MLLGKGGVGGVLGPARVGAFAPWGINSQLGEHNFLPPYPKRKR